MARTRTLTLKVTSDELAALTEAANAAGLGLRPYVRLRLGLAVEPGYVDRLLIMMARLLEFERRMWECAARKELSGGEVVRDIGATVDAVQDKVLLAKYGRGGG